MSSLVIGEVQVPPEKLLIEHSILLGEVSAAVGLKALDQAENRHQEHLDWEGFGQHASIPDSSKPT